MENANDSSGNGYNLSSQGSPTYVNGRFGLAGNFNGSSALYNTSAVWSSGTSWTLLFWIYDSSGTSAIRRWVVNNNDALAANDVILRENSGEIQLLINGGAGNVTTSGQTWKNAWHHFAIISDGTNTKVYKDANPTAIISTANVSTPTSKIYIGGWYNTGSNEYSTSKIDEVIVEDRAWTMKMLRMYYTHALGKFSPILLNN